MICTRGVGRVHIVHWVTNPVDTHPCNSKGPTVGPTWSQSVSSDNWQGSYQYLVVSTAIRTPECRLIGSNLAGKDDATFRGIQQDTLEGILDSVNPVIVVVMLTAGAGKVSCSAWLGGSGGMTVVIVPLDVNRISQYLLQVREKYTWKQRSMLLLTSDIGSAPRTVLWNKKVRIFQNPDRIASQRHWRLVAHNQGLRSGTSWTAWTVVTKNWNAWRRKEYLKGTRSLVVYSFNLSLLRAQFLSQSLSLL